MIVSPCCRESRMPLTRRALLKAFLAAWTTSCATRWQVTLADTEPSTNGCPDWLLRITGRRDAVLRLGRAYLEAHSEGKDTERLLASVDQALAGLQGENSRPPEDSAQMITALKRVVRDEYIGDQVTLLQGWVVSLTEARLYALAAMFYGA
jgi:hypothetical protein